jgi:hypothetical protein
MKVDQIAVFLENKSGRLAAITKALSDNNINIRALSVADTADFGILRLIVDDTDKATRVLKEGGFTVGKTDVIAVEVADRPGGLARVLAVLHEADYSSAECRHTNPDRCGSQVNLSSMERKGNIGLE